MDKDTFFSKKRSIRLGEKLLMIDHPLVMGILNISPESFYVEKGMEGAKLPEAFLRKAENLIPYCDMIDVGAVSSRPGAPYVSEEEEIRRLDSLFPILIKHFPGFPFSVDTCRGKAAEEAVAAGACLVNDISGGTMDPTLFPTLARLNVPYVFSHIQGTPETMQTNPVYEDVVAEVLSYFAEGIRRLHDLGIVDLILDPGFGFGKSLEHNYLLLKHLEEFQLFELPLMAGFSRKSMIQKVLKLNSDECLNGTTVLNTIALLKGADILRVHDPREARETISLVQQLLSV